MLHPTPQHNSQPIQNLKVYFSDTHLQITNSYIKVNNKTYSVQHLTSVELMIVKPLYLQTALLGFGLGAVIGFFIGYILGSVNFIAGIISGSIAGTIVMILALLGLKRRYLVNLCFSSGERTQVADIDEQRIRYLAGLFVQTIADNQ